MKNTDRPLSPAIADELASLRRLARIFPNSNRLETKIKDMERKRRSAISPIEKEEMGK